MGWLRLVSAARAPLASLRGKRLFSQLAQRKSLHFEIDADNLFRARLIAEPGALAEFGEAQVGCLKAGLCSGAAEAIPRHSAHGQGGMVG